MQIYMYFNNFELYLLIIIHLFLDITLLVLFRRLFYFFSHIVFVLVIFSSSGYDCCKVEN